MLAPARKANRYKYSGPGPYRQLKRSAVTLASKLSSTGRAVGVSVGRGVKVGVIVAVGGTGVDVSRAGILVVVLATVAVDGAVGAGLDTLQESMLRISRVRMGKFLCFTP